MNLNEFNSFYHINFSHFSNLFDLLTYFILINLFYQINYINFIS